MISEAYVFIEGLEEEPVICAKFRYDVTRKVGQLRYGKSYLARKDAFPLDPIHLPLSQEIFTTKLNKGIFGVLSDAGADAWGRKLILQLRRTKPQNELEFLIAGATMGVGAIGFSLSRSKAKAKQSRNTLADLDLLLRGKKAILNAEDVSIEVKKAFQFGDSMGGARPKTLLVDNNQTYLLKFNRADDLYNVARVEYATMQMLAELDGVRTADVRLFEGEEDVLMVKRFDRRLDGESESVSHHFISANSLLMDDHVNEAALRSWYSYGALAELLRKHSASADDAPELFKRMVFNVLIGNTDDHARNHAMLWHLQERHWRLAPAYDVLPISNSKEHGFGIGDDGRAGTVENILSQSRRFGLQPYKARAVVKEVQELVAEWQVYFKHHGVGAGDIEILRNIIK
jgi:serine/threonine-protein kinase HipA